MLDIVFLNLIFQLQLCAFSQNMPDFGPDGMADLTPTQKRHLGQHEIIILKREKQTVGEKVLIEAALLFHQPPGKVWNLLVRTEDQVKYLDEVKRIVVLYKTPTEDKLEFATRILTKTVIFRVCHMFDEKNHYISWSLDKTFPSDLKEFSGFWRLYPFGERQTLARYGSRVIPRFPVPAFILDALLKHNLSSALAATKKYIDAGVKLPREAAIF